MCLFLLAKKDKKNNNYRHPVSIVSIRDLESRSGTILIVALWTLVILTVFALTLGQRAALEIKLAEYQRDALKAQGLVKAAIEMAIWEKAKDTNATFDALSESWANKTLLFGETAHYIMKDEEGKININEVEERVLVNLLESLGAEEPEKLASSILIWLGKKPDAGNSEEEYYQGLDLPYHCKKEKLESIAELLLVRDMPPELLYGEDADEDGKISEEEEGLAQYLTVYGPGTININTASEKVVTALIGGNFAELSADGVAAFVEKIVGYRQGLDGTPGTDDDGQFSISGEPLELSVDEQFFNIYGATALEWEKLKTLYSARKLSSTSNTYTIYAHAEVKKVKKFITATVSLSEPERIKYLYWNRN